MPEEPEEEPVPRRSSIDSLISHLRNEEVEEIVTDVFEEMSYEVWVSNLGAVLTTIAKDEKPVEEIFVSHYSQKITYEGRSDSGQGQYRGDCGLYGREIS